MHRPVWKGAFVSAPHTVTVVPVMFPPPIRDLRAEATEADPRCSRGQRAGDGLAQAIHRALRRPSTRATNSFFLPGKFPNLYALMPSQPGQVKRRQGDGG